MSGKLKAGGGEYDYRLAPGGAFNGLRLEVLTGAGDVWFDVSLPAEGELAIRTFSSAVPHELILAAIAAAGRLKPRHIL